MWHWLDRGAPFEGEISDVMIYLSSLADKSGLKPMVVANRKLAVDARKYPAEIARGRSEKSEY